MSASPFNRDCLRGKVALVTGGGSGIGFGISTALCQHGACVVIMGRRKKFLEEAVQELRKLGGTVESFAGDVRSEESAQAAVEYVVRRFGKLNVLINGAAGNFLANANELSLKGFKTVMEIDTMGVFNMSRQSFEALKASGSSVIINISMTLHYGATWYQAHASAAKSAIDSLTRTLALEWGSYGIRVNGIAPGPIADTPGMAKLSAAFGPSKMEKSSLQKVPLARLGSTKDIAMGVVFLCSSAASYVTGDTLVVDGGEWLYKPAMLPPSSVSAISRAVEGSSRAMGVKSKL
ncbi:unnamed protein product [Chrysoparadoxa australica]